MKFRLKKKTGPHFQDGRVYHAGDFVETSHDLAAMFPSKFERVYREQQLEEAAKALAMAAEADTIHDEHEVSEEMVKKPDIFVPPGENEVDKAVKENEGGVDPPETKTSPSSEKITDGKADQAPDYGEDITSEFPTAGELEIRIFEKGPWCTVIDSQDGEVLNEKKLRRKNVDAFLEQYVGT